MLMALSLCAFFMDLRTNNLSWLLAYSSLTDCFCITEVDSVYCSVRTGSYKSRYFFVLKAVKNSPIYYVYECDQQQNMSYNNGLQ